MPQSPLPRLGLNDDGTRWFDCPAVLLDRLEIRLSVYDESVRAEVWQLKGAAGPEGHLVWQHHADLPHTADSATCLAAHYLDTTTQYLAQRGFPGVTFD